MENTRHAFVGGLSTGNVWDDGYPSGGNYWDNYTGVDSNHDGIGDTPYIIDADNVDNYPLMETWVVPTETIVTIGGQSKPVSVSSNATVTQMITTPNTLSFNVTGPSGQKGYVQIVFPMVNTTDIEVYVDGALLVPPPVITTNGTHYFIYCEFTFSSHIITVSFASLPTIESCDASGTRIDTFMVYENVYASGSGYEANTVYNVYVVVDTNWIDGMPIPSYVTRYTVTSSSSGIIPPILVWGQPLTPGKYDIVVDVNGNGKYDAGVDALDDNQMQVTAGFFVVPEYPLGTFLGVVTCIAALAVFKSKRIHANKD